MGTRNIRPARWSDAEAQVREGETVYQRVFDLLANAGVPLRLVEEGEASVVEFDHEEGVFQVLLSTPPFKELAPGRAQLLSCHSVRGTAMAETAATQRLCLPVLVNDRVADLTPQSSSHEAEELLASGEWQLLRWEEIVARALLAAADELGARYALTQAQVSSVLNRAVVSTLQKIEVVQNPLHLMVWGAGIVLGYPGKDVNQGPNPQVSREVLMTIKDAFWRKADELGYDVTFTSKSSPGRKVLAKASVSRVQKIFGIWPSAANVRRSNRELASMVKGAQKFVSERNMVPEVIGDPIPTAAKDYIRFVNAAVVTFDQMVPNGVSVDQLMVTGWAIKDGTFDVEVERTAEVPLNEAETAEDALLPFPEGATAEQVSRPLGPGIERFWAVTYRRIHRSDETMKLVTPDGVKGMVQVTKKLVVEKRPGEAFLRPVYLIIPEETVVSKDARRMILRMAASRVCPGVQTADISREEIPEAYDKFASMGSVTSDLFEFIPDVSGISVEIRGFGEMVGRLVPLASDVHTGEVAVARVQEDEHHGRAFHEVRLDPFMVMGKKDHAGRPLVDRFAPSDEALDFANYVREVYLALGA